MMKSRNADTSELILSAVFSLQKSNGVTLEEIVKYICDKRGCKEKNIKELVNKSLEKALKNGIFSKTRGLYRIKSNFGLNTNTSKSDSNNRKNTKPKKFEKVSKKNATNKPVKNSKDANEIVTKCVLSQMSCFPDNPDDDTQFVYYFPTPHLDKEDEDDDDDFFEEEDDDDDDDDLFGDDNTIVPIGTRAEPSEACPAVKRSYKRKKQPSQNVPNKTRRNNSRSASRQRNVKRRNVSQEPDKKYQLEDDGQTMQNECVNSEGDEYQHLNDNEYDLNSDEIDDEVQNNDADRQDDEEIDVQTIEGDNDCQETQNDQDIEDVDADCQEVEDNENGDENGVYGQENQENDWEQHGGGGEGDENVAGDEYQENQDDEEIQENQGDGTNEENADGDEYQGNDDRDDECHENDYDCNDYCGQNYDDGCQENVENSECQQSDCDHDLCKKSEKSDCDDENLTEDAKDCDARTQNYSENDEKNNSNIECNSIETTSSGCVSDCQSDCQSQDDCQSQKNDNPQKQKEIECKDQKQIQKQDSKIQGQNPNECRTQDKDDKKDCRAIKPNNDRLQGGNDSQSENKSLSAETIGKGCDCSKETSKSGPEDKGKCQAVMPAKQQGDSKTEHSLSTTKDEDKKQSTKEVSKNNAGVTDTGKSGPIAGGTNCESKTSGQTPEGTLTPVQTEVHHNDRQTGRSRLKRKIAIEYSNCNKNNKIRCKGHRTQLRRVDRSSD